MKRKSNELGVISRDRLRQGFTIVELLIVIVVIAILATITVVSYNGIKQRAEDAATATNIGQISKGLEVMFNLKGQYYDVTTPSHQACLGSAPDDTSTCGTVTIAGSGCSSLGIAESTAPYAVNYDDGFNQALKELIGVIPKGVQSTSYTMKQSTTNCDATADIKGAVYQAAKQIDIYRYSDGRIGSTVHHRFGTSTAPTGRGAYSIQYPTNDGECRVPGSMMYAQKGTSTLGAWTFTTDKDVCVVLGGDVRYFAL